MAGFFLSFVVGGSTLARTNATTTVKFPFSSYKPPGKNYLGNNCIPSATAITGVYSGKSRYGQSLFSPASPTASPESEYLSHGVSLSRGRCKGGPRTQSSPIRVPVSYVGDASPRCRASDGSGRLVVRRSAVQSAGSRRTSSVIDESHVADVHIDWTSFILPAYDDLHPRLDARLTRIMKPSGDAVGNRLLPQTFSRRLELAGPRLLGSSMISLAGQGTKSRSDFDGSRLNQCA